MPRELKPLYSRLLELVEPIYLTWVSKALQILQAYCNSIHSLSIATSLSEFTISDFFFSLSATVLMSLRSLEVPGSRNNHHSTRRWLLVKIYFVHSYQ